MLFNIISCSVESLLSHLICSKQRFLGTAVKFTFTCLVWCKTLSWLKYIIRRKNWKWSFTIIYNLYWHLHESMFVKHIVITSITSLIKDTLQRIMSKLSARLKCTIGWLVVPGYENKDVWSRDNHRNIYWFFTRRAPRESYRAPL